MSLGSVGMVMGSMGPHFAFPDPAGKDDMVAGYGYQEVIWHCREILNRN